ncbi:MAG: FAD binding domain-containing protein [Anaerolineales bacterium]|nr:FAD binding domain-containing protein [Anaerolineales bacterium]
MWQKYINATNVEEVLKVLAEYGEKARIVAGATDLILEIERGIRKGIEVVIDITRIPKLDQIVLDEADWIHLGPMVTHNHCVSSKLVRERGYLLARAAWEVGAPQIRNRGTVAGNLITASPANDTITPLMALGAQVTLRSAAGERVVPLSEFYLGVRKNVMQTNEMLVDIAFPAMAENQRGTFLKLGLRRSQAISVVDVAVMLTFEEDTVSDAAITLGAVAPTIIHARSAEAYLKGKPLSGETIEAAARLTMNDSRPIDDIRGSAAYRREMVRVLAARGLGAIARGEEQLEFPSDPVLLWGQSTPGDAAKNPAGSTFSRDETIHTTINGQVYTFAASHTKTLLQLLRDEAGLIGTKEGCAEGECGACTVFLDGVAVMSCLVPAARAHGAQVTTVEGLAQPERLHPVQDAFVHEGAVQCGYCTPGFVMSAAKLLEEYPQPSREQIQHAITGNLCRCTGYYKIVTAIEAASQMEV